MIISNVYEAKAKLSSLVNQAISGNEVYISKAGEPKVKLVPVKKNAKERKPGIFEGEIEISDDFDELPEYLLAYFNGVK